MQWLNFYYVHSKSRSMHLFEVAQARMRMAVDKIADLMYDKYRAAARVVDADMKRAPNLPSEDYMMYRGKLFDMLVMSTGFPPARPEGYEAMREKMRKASEEVKARK